MSFNIKYTRSKDICTGYAEMGCVITGIANQAAAMLAGGRALDAQISPRAWIKEWRDADISFAYKPSVSAIVRDGDSGAELALDGYCYFQDFKRAKDAALWQLRGAEGGPAAMSPVDRNFASGAAKIMHSGNGGAVSFEISYSDDWWETLAGWGVRIDAASAKPDALAICERVLAGFNKRGGWHTVEPTEMHDGFMVAYTRNLGAYVHGKGDDPADIEVFGFETEADAQTAGYALAAHICGCGARGETATGYSLLRCVCALPRPVDEFAELAASGF